ncbi:MAG: hypothetical protein ACXWZM_00210 [Solirubrobacterales bacterium]
MSAANRQDADVGPLGAVQAFGVMLGGPVALVVVAGVSVRKTLRRVQRGRPPSPAAALGAAGLLAYVLVLRPRIRNWGARPHETRMALPGDELEPDPGMQTTRAVTISAPPGDVWPWLAQLGQERGGFYSYEWLENLAGCRMRNADEIHPEWQHREVGESIMLHPAAGLKMTLFEPERAFGIENWGAFVLEPEGDGRTRLLARGRAPHEPLKMAYATLLEIPHFVMERRMLLGIKERAERRFQAGS